MNLATKKILAYAAVFLLWGASYSAIRIIVKVIPPFLAASIRYTAAGLILFLVAALRKKVKANPRQLLNCIWTGILLFTTMYAALFWAETILPSWVVAVLMSTVALWIYLGECLVLRTAHLNARMIAALMLGIIGILVLAVIRTTQQTSFGVAGIIVVLMGAAIWAGSSLALKEVDLPESMTLSAGLQLLSSGLSLFLLAWLIGGKLHVAKPELVLDRAVVGAMTFLVLGPSMLGFTSYYWLLQHEPASRVATSAFINPMVAMVLGIALQHEACSMQQLGGSAAILGSTAYIWFFQSVKETAAKKKTAPNVARTVFTE
jgi:drug/metabolite transporter (DMT)-like permease